MYEWHKPAAGTSPTPTTFDFTALPNAAGVVKNDSDQTQYNTWTAGDGGVCPSVWKGTCVSAHRWAAAHRRAQNGEMPTN